MLKYLLMLLLFQTIIVFGQSWRNVGPEGVVGSSILCLAADPNNYQILYAGSSDEGVFKSIDEGENWFRINNGIKKYYISSLAVNPKNPSIIFAGSNNGVLYKSINGGNDWIEIQYEFPPYSLVCEIVFTPTQPDTTYVAFSGDATWPGGLYKTTNGGSSWTEISTTFKNKNVYAIAIDQNNQSIVYAGSKFYYGSNNHPNNHGLLYKSYNSGMTWNTKELPSSRTIRASIKDICIDPNNSEIIFVATDSDGVLRSMDAGTNWEIMNSEIWSFTLCKMKNIVLNPMNSDTMYVTAMPPNDGEPAVFKSTDGGDNWFGSSEGLNREYGNYIMINNEKPNKLYLATENGFLKTENSAELWRSSFNGLSLIHANKLLINPYDTDTWWTKTNQGIFYTSDKGDNWNYFSRYIFPTIYHPQEPTVFGLIGEGSYSDAVFKSSNGFNWEQLSYLIGGQTIAIDFISPEIMYVPTSRGIFKSTDGGYNWFEISNGLTEKSIYDLIIDFSDTQKLYAISLKNVWKSDNAGETWENFGGPFNNDGYNPVTIDINPENPLVLYVSTENGLYRNSTGDTNWQFIAMPEGEITSFIVNPSDTSIFYAGYDGIGVYTSENSGEEWKELNSGLTNKRIKSLALEPNNSSFILAGSKSDGLYVYQIIPNSVKNQSDRDTNIFFDLSIYPNPFNSITNINYSIPHSSHVVISIYDMLGRQVETLVNSDKQEGMHDVQYNSNELSSGIYIVKISTNYFFKTKKIMLMK